jgi:hypothetical protein
MYNDRPLFFVYAHLCSNKSRGLAWDYLNAIFFNGLNGYKFRNIQ